MNPEYDKQLESCIDREIKALPLIAAPASLQTQVMAALGSRAALPSTAAARQWPLGLRIVAFVALATAFTLACYGLFSVPAPGAVLEAGRNFAGASKGFSMISGIAGTVFQAVCFGLRNLGTPVLIGLCGAVLFSYLAAIGFGTLLYRLTSGLAIISERKL